MRTGTQVSVHRNNTTATQPGEGEIFSISISYEIYLGLDDVYLRNKSISYI